MSISSIFDPGRTLEQRRQAVANLFDFVVRGGVADTRRMPSTVIDDGPHRTLLRYESLPDVPVGGPPVLLVPPLGSPASCYDLRRGCSLVEHLVTEGHPTYLVDYGPIDSSDKRLGVEYWINEVVPPAIQAVSADAGGQPVQLIGWCMGGLFSLVTTAAYPDLPVHLVAMIASPFDVSHHPLLAPVRAIGSVTHGQVLGSAIRALGGMPARMVGPAFKLTSLPTYLKKPITLLRHRDDRDFLAQVEAVDDVMNGMLAYPGRATLQIYQRVLQRNELASGVIHGPNRVVELADVRVPVMNIAGRSDVLVPVKVAHHVAQLLPNSPQVRLETAPGGHLGVLTGRTAPLTTWSYLDDFMALHHPEV